jgi:hypothetical protein
MSSDAPALARWCTHQDCACWRAPTLPHRSAAASSDCERVPSKPMSFGGRQFHGVISPAAEFLHTRGGSGCSPARCDAHGIIPRTRSADRPCLLRLPSGQPIQVGRLPTGRASQPRGCALVVRRWASAPAVFSPLERTCDQPKWTGNRPKSASARRIRLVSGDGGGIRTHGTLARPAVFRPPPIGLDKPFPDLARQSARQRDAAWRWAVGSGK